MIHHYTSIETLALILRSGKIRFNRLNRVDDVSESQTFGAYNLSSFLYVSCWTDATEESIPLWHMYTGNMKGVRLSFPDGPFAFKKIPKNNSIGAMVDGEVVSPIEIDDLFGENYFIVPTFLDRRFGGKVAYVDDIEGIYSDAVQFIPNGDGTHKVITSNINELALHKSIVWAFQQEYRFVMHVLPTPSHGRNFAKNPQGFVSHFATCIREGIAPDVNYIDIPMCPDGLRSMEVTLGPLSTPADEIIVRSLLKEFCENENVKYSELKGTIRARGA